MDRCWSDGRGICIFFDSSVKKADRKYNVFERHSQKWVSFYMEGENDGNTGLEI